MKTLSNGGGNTMVAAPATLSSPGTVGQTACDGKYYYKCIATNTWVSWPVNSS